MKSWQAESTIFTEAKRYTDMEAWHRSAAALRIDNPVCRVEAEGYRPFWAITRHADIIEVESQPEIFPNTPYSVLLPDIVLNEQKTSGLGIKSLVHMDDPEHKAHRQITNEWFKPRNLRQVLEQRIQELCRDFVDRMQSLGENCDFARDIGLYYPLHVIMSIFGVPEKDEALMLKLTQQLFGNEDPEFGGDDRKQAMITAAMEFYKYFNELTTSRREAHKDDIASVIANAKIDGEYLGDLERTSYYIIVATAGHDTTSSSLAGGLEALIRNPEQLRKLQDNPELIDNAVEEMIRWSTPVRHFLRQAARDYVLAGTKIKKGDWLLLSYLSANRDEAIFDDPFRFDIHRSNADQQLAFGIGVHFCLGAHLARMELRSFFRELLPRLEKIEFSAEPEYLASTFVGGIKNLPINYRLRDHLS